MAETDTTGTAGTNTAGTATAEAATAQADATDAHESAGGAESAGPAPTTATPKKPGDAGPGKIGTGPGRLLLWLYGMFTVAALSRSIVQISTRFHHAPLAYALSAVAGVVYAVILVALVKGGEPARRVAMVCCSAELLGVLTVGTLTIADSSAFADSTVWSYYGAGYLLLPLVLPVAGLLWLRRSARGADGEDVLGPQRPGTE